MIAEKNKENEKKIRRVNQRSRIQSNKIKKKTQIETLDKLTSKYIVVSLLLLLHETSLID